jgi:stage II sporulation protein AA (anti-sigma F factor antagonist)
MIDFGVRVVTANGRAIVFVSGEIDMLVEERLAGALEAAQYAVADVTVDLTKVTFMDSSGLNVLVRAYQRAPERGSCRVVGARGLARRVMDLTGVAALLLDEQEQDPVSKRVRPT